MGAGERFLLTSKIFVTVVPLIIIATVNSEIVNESALLWAILSHSIMVLSLTAGTILLILRLTKYVKTRRLKTRYMRRSRL